MKDQFGMDIKEIEQPVNLDIFTTNRDHNIVQNQVVHVVMMLLSIPQFMEKWQHILHVYDKQKNRVRREMEPIGETSQSVLIMNLQDNPENSGTYYDQLDYRAPTQKGTGTFMLNHNNTLHSINQPGPTDRLIGYQTLTIHHIQIL